MTSIFSQDHFVENARLSAALELSDLGCWELSLLDRKFWMSERFQSHFEFMGGSIVSYEEMIGLVDRRDRENTRISIDDALVAGSNGRFDIRVRTHAGHLGRAYWVNWKGQAVFSDNGTPTHFSGIVQDVSGQVARADLVANKEALLANIVENTSDMLSRWDLNANRIWANAAFHQNFETLSLQNESTSDFVAVQGLSTKFKEYVQKAINLTIALHCDPGDSEGGISMHASFLPEFNADHELESILVVEHIVSVQDLHFKEDENTRVLELEDLNQQLAVVNEEYTAANEELAQANQLLFKSNENLAQFAFVASHDLQEPLRKIHSFGDLLRRRISTSSEGIEYLDRMQQAAKRMSVLIEDLLSFSRVSSRQEDFRVVDLNEVFKGVLSDLETSIDQSGAVIIVPELPSLIGDSRQLSQLFQNLLSNAVKFRRQNTQPKIQIIWNIVKASDVPGLTPDNVIALSYDRIDIIDDGIGFEKIHENRIFKVFQRLHGKSEYEGTGIGLAICEKVVANHRGLIKVESEIGTGSTFSVYLPIGR